MHWTELIPDFLKPVFRPIYNALVSTWVYRKISFGVDRKILRPPKSRNELRQYWREPWDGQNLPHFYLEGEPRSQFFVGIVKRYASPNTNILEIGCNVGRNLNHLFEAGFKNLEALEISEKAVQLLKQSYPEMARHTKIYNMPVEEIIKEFDDSQFDIVFTMAVLEHVHTDSEWIFSEMARITKSFLITIENEVNVSWRHFPRTYKKVFERLGMKQIEEINCKDVDGLGFKYFARIFKKV